MRARAGIASCSGDRACPIRWRYGDDRPCLDHQRADHADDLSVRAAELAQAPPGQLREVAIEASRLHRAEKDARWRARNWQQPADPQLTGVST